MLADADLHVTQALLVHLGALAQRLASGDRVEHPVAVLRQALTLNLRDCVETPLLCWQPGNGAAVLYAAPELHALAVTHDVGPDPHVALGRALDALSLFA